MHQAKAKSPSRLVALVGLLLTGFALSGCSDRPNDPFSPAHPRESPRSLLVSPGGGTWTTRASMPTARDGSAAGVIDGILYVAGGYGAAGQLATTEAYNPGTNSWSARASMPAARYGGSGAGVIGGELYVVGGWTVSPALPNTSLFIYNPVSNAWRSGANMPIRSSCGSTGVINGKLYVTTACDGYNGYRSFLHVYNPITNMWTQLASSPNAHLAPAAGVIGGRLYVAGGSNASGVPSTTLDVYDPEIGTWLTKAPMSEAHTGPGEAVVDGKLYVIGGWNGSQYAGTVEVYDPETNVWTTLASMPTPRYELATGVIAGIVYAAGGYGGASRLAIHEAFSPTPPRMADQTISFGVLSNATFGDPPFALNATASSGLPVSFTASGNCTVAGTMVSLTGAGTCTITANQVGDAHYNPAPSVVQSFAIARARPVIVWNAPASMVYGEALGAAQLNATATGVGGGSLLGAFNYSPPAGTVLDPGTQILALSFNPDDGTNYTGASKSVSIAVLYNTAVGHAFLQPINLPFQPQSVFKAGSTIPVKFHLFLADGVTPVGTAVATIRVTKGSDGVPVLSNVPNAGTTFRYDPEEQQYIFNLSTKNWSAGSYRITALLDDGSQIIAVVGAR